MLDDRDRGGRQLEHFPTPLAGAPDQRAADNPWPLWPNIFRVSGAHEEGGERVYAVSTQRFLGDDRGRVKALEAVKVDMVREGGRVDFKPVAGTYSPYGVLYGFSSNLIEHMALKTLQPDTVTQFGLEDVFAQGGSDKLAWVSGWRKLPHLKREIESQFDYPQQFAEEIFDRIESALRRRASGGDATAVPTGRFVVLAGDVPDLPAGYTRSSDKQLVGARQADYQDEPHLLSDRREGKCVLSYKTSGGWVAITKAILTDVLGAGQDVTIVGLPPEAADALNAMMSPLLVSSRLGSA